MTVTPPLASTASSSRVRPWIIRLTGHLPEAPRAPSALPIPMSAHPVTRLPCPPEVLVERIVRGEASVAAPLAGMRVLQGKLKVALRRLREPAA